MLDSDASDEALSLVLQQKQDGVLKVITYASRALQPAERSYCTTRKELLAVIYGLKHFRQFLLGCLNISIPNRGTGRTTSEKPGSVGRVRHGNRAPARRVTSE